MTKVLAISGSLRSDSYNSKLLRNAAELFGDDVEVEILGGLKDVPPYDEDDDHDGAPEAVAALRAAFAGADAVIHAAGMYRIGIGRSERGAMWDANVGATTRFLDAAERAGAPRIVCLSTVNVFGNTHGRVVDESYRRDLAEGFVS